MSGSCLTRETWIAFLEERLPEPDRTAAAEHLNGCPECEARVEEIVAALGVDRPAPGLGSTDESAELQSFLRQLKQLPRESADRFATSALESSDEPASLAATVVQGASADTVVTQPDVRSTADTIGPYRLKDVLGQGGFGIVYKAEQVAPLRRTVALKVIKPGMGSREVVARFEAERQALAVMDHPHIAHVLDAGTTAAGQPYFVMDLVDGVPITSWCDTQRLTIRRRLELFITVCQAVQHAHMKGIIHRDLKPSNVLVTERDGQPHAKVIDFGIAKALGQSADLSLTTAGQMIGTPLYMSPEQAGESASVDTRSDVYSLGVILYELLTGVTPFDSERLGQASLWDKLRILREEEPPPPSLRSSERGPAMESVAAGRNCRVRDLPHRLRRDLDWIALTALAKNPDRRYPSAAALAEDLRRYLNGRPITARPIAWWERAVLWVRSNAIITAAATVVTACLIAVIVVMWMAGSQQRELNGRLRTSLGRAHKAEEEARKAEEVTRQAAHRADDLRYAAEIRLALEHAQAGDSEQALLLLDHWIPTSGRPDHRGLEWRLLRQMFQKNGEELLRLPGEVSCIRMYPRRSIVFAATDGGAISRYDLRRRLQLPGWKADLTDVRRMAFSRDGERLALISYQGEVVILSGETGNFIARLKLPAETDGAPAVAFVGTFHRLLASGYDGAYLRWQSKSGVRKVRVPHEISDLAVCDNPGLVAMLGHRSSESFVEIVNNNTPPKSLAQVPLNITGKALALSRDGCSLAVGDAQGEIQVWEWMTPRLLAATTFSEPIRDLAFSADGQWIATAERSGMVHVWHWQADIGLPGQASPERASVQYHWRAHRRPAQTVVFDPDKPFVISSGGDGRVIRWPIVPRENLRISSAPDALAWLPGLDAIAFGDNRQIRIFDRRTGALLKETEPGMAPARRLATAPNGLDLASASFSGEVSYWKVDTEVAPTRFTEGPGLPRVERLGFLPGSNHLFAFNDADTLQFRSWDPKTRQLTGDWDVAADVPGHASHCGRDGSLVFLGDRSLAVLDFATGRLRNRWPLPDADGTCLAVSHRGDIAAIGRNDRRIEVVDTRTGKVRQTLLGNLSGLESVEFSPDDRTLLALDKRGRLKLWQPEYGSELLTWPSPEPIQAFSLSPDGKWLALVRAADTEIIDVSGSGESLRRPTTEVTLAGDDLLIADVAFQGQNDSLTLRSDGVRLFVSDANASLEAKGVAGAVLSDDGHEVSVPYASIPGSRIIVDTSRGTDALTVDYTLGTFPKEIVYNERLQASRHSLKLTGARPRSVSHSLTSRWSGTVLVDGNRPISYSGAMSIDDRLAVSERTVSFGASDDNVTIRDFQGSTSVAMTGGLPVLFATPPGRLTVNLGAGQDTLTVRGRTQPFSASLTIQGGPGDDVVHLAGNVQFEKDRSLTVNLQSDRNPGLDRIVVADDASLEFSGTGSARLTASRSIAMNPGSSLTTETGSIVLEANQQTPSTPGPFIGVELNQSRIVSGTGSIRLCGRGGHDESNVTYGHTGIQLHHGSAIESTKSASITLEGAGGVGEKANHGVLILGEGTRVTSVDGNVTITGHGGAGLNQYQYGVALSDGAHGIETTGSAKVSIVAVGGSGSADNFGLILGGRTRIQTGNADVDIVARAGHDRLGGEAGQVSTALRLENESTLCSTGGNITLKADSIQALHDSRILAVTRGVTLRPARTADLAEEDSGDAIEIHSGPESFTPNTLELSGEVLNRIEAGTIQIGDEQAGSITIADPLQFSCHLSVVSQAEISIGSPVTLAQDRNVTFRARRIMRKAAVNVSGSGRVLFLSPLTH